MTDYGNLNPIAPKQITRAALLTLPENGGFGYSIGMPRPGNLTGTAYLAVVAKCAEGTGYCQSRVTGLLYRYEQTGSALKGRQVRCRVVPAVDTGDLVGTITFEESKPYPAFMNVDLTV